MESLESFRSFAVALPNLAKFAFAMLILVGTPPLCRRINLPSVVGLLLAGVLTGPYGLGIFGENRPTPEFFADLDNRRLTWSSY